MLGEWTGIVVVVLAWGGYPLIIRAAGVGGALGAMVLTLSALFPIALALWWQGNFVRPANADLLRVVAGGLFMGVGTTAFNFVVNSRKLDASTSVPIMDTGMLLVTTLGAVWFYGEPFSARKALGIALLVVGIGILRPA